MRVPRRFLLGGQAWRVKWLRRGQDEWDEDASVRGLLPYGECSYSERLITLNPFANGDTQEKWDSFVHELLHAIDHYEEEKGTKGWHLPHAVISRLAGPLAAWMIENRVSIPEPK